MALINLQHISFLYHEAKFNKNVAIRQSFNLPENEDRLIRSMPDATYVRLIKTHVQAKVIYKNLKRLHKICTDFASGNFQPYIDKHNLYEDKYPVEDKNEYQPLVEIDMLFNEAIDYPLPRTIEQYIELLDLCHDFTEIRNRKRDGLNPFTGSEPMYYEVIDEEGEKIILPPSELPEDYVNQQKAVNDIRSIQAEYALDNYNTFREQAWNLYLEAHETKDIAKYAKAILSLYTPTN